MKWGAAAALLLAAMASRSAAADPARYMTAELIAQTRSPQPGSTILIGIRFTPKPGWHGYWSNPGDSGIAPSVRWTAPGGVRFGPLLHPAPSLLTASGVSSFVHEGPHVLLSRIAIPRSITRGRAIPVVANLRWAACTASQCVPLHAKLTLRLIAGNGAKSAEWGLIHAAVEKLPRPASDGSWVREGHRVRLRLPDSVKLDPASTRFFPDTPGAFDTAAASAKRIAARTVIDAPAGPAIPRSLGGVVSDGRSAYRLRFVEAVRRRRR